jgi:hypothetical protein
MHEFYPLMHEDLLDAEVHDVPVSKCTLIDVVLVLCDAVDVLYSPVTVLCAAVTVLWNAVRGCTSCCSCPADPFEK